MRAVIESRSPRREPRPREVAEEEPALQRADPGHAAMGTPRPRIHHRPRRAGLDPAGTATPPRRGRSGDTAAPGVAARRNSETGRARFFGGGRIHYTAGPDASSPGPAIVATIRRGAGAGCRPASRLGPPHPRLTHAGQHPKVAERAGRPERARHGPRGPSHPRRNDHGQSVPAPLDADLVGESLPAAPPAAQGGATPR